MCQSKILKVNIFNSFNCKSWVTHRLNQSHWEVLNIYSYNLLSLVYIEKYGSELLEQSYYIHENCTSHYFVLHLPETWLYNFLQGLWVQSINFFKTNANCLGVNSFGPISVSFIVFGYIKSYIIAFSHNATILSNSSYEKIEYKCTVWNNF